MRKTGIIIVLILSMLCSACTGVSKQPEDEKVPSDFYFRLTWGCYGNSSYDSATGKLVKTKDATNPEDYVTSYFLTEEEKEEIYELIQKLDVDKYPECYNPHDNLMSSPTMTLILVVCEDGEEKMIAAKDIALSFDADNLKGQNFLDTCKGVRDILLETKEWKALPEYEFLYD